MEGDITYESMNSTSKSNYQYLISQGLIYFGNLINVSELNK